jgi:hypothetical protein
LNARKLPTLSHRTLGLISLGFATFWGLAGPAGAQTTSEQSTAWIADWQGWAAPLLNAGSSLLTSSTDGLLWLRDQTDAAVRPYVFLLDRTSAAESPSREDNADIELPLPAVPASAATSPSPDAAPGLTRVAPLPDLALAVTGPAAPDRSRSMPGVPSIWDEATTPLASPASTTEAPLPLGSNDIPGVGVVSEPAQRLPDGSLFVPKSTQRMLGVQTVRVAIDSSPMAKELVGRIIPSPSYSGLVQPGQAGRVLMSDTGMPHLGMQIEKDQVLALLEPALTIVEHAGLLNDMADVSSRLKMSKERLARIRSFYWVPFREGKVRLAELEIDGLRRRYAVLHTMLTRKIEVRASASGVISAIKATPGQFVTADSVLFEIVDPNKLWIEAVAFDPSLAEAVTEATATTADQKPLLLRYVGSGRTLRNQAIPMNFEVVNPPAGLVAGQPVRLVVTGSRMVEGIVVPRRSLVRSNNGEFVVWERTAPERFISRAVVAKPIDAERALVTAGVSLGVPVVVNGAPFLSQIR